MGDFVFDFNKLILELQFEVTLKGINKINLSIPNFSANVQMDNNDSFFTSNGTLVVV